MDVGESQLAALLKTLDVLRSYLGEIVVIGGWAPLLYRRYGNLPQRHPTLFTRDIDIVVPRRSREAGRPTIDALLCDAGYEARVYGSELTSVTKYELSSPTASEVEFLTPEIGQPGEPSRTVQRGLTAQLLRFLSILQENTMEIRVSENLSDFTVDLTVQIPTPVSLSQVTIDKWCHI